MQRLRERVDKFGRRLERFLFERDLGNGFFAGRLANDERGRGRVWGRRCVADRVLRLSCLLRWVYKKAFARSDARVSERRGRERSSEKENAALKAAFF